MGFAIAYARRSTVSVFPDPVAPHTADAAQADSGRQHDVATRARQRALPAQARLSANTGLLASAAPAQEACAAVAGVAGGALRVCVEAPRALRGYAVIMRSELRPLGRSRTRKARPAPGAAQALRAGARVAGVVKYDDRVIAPLKAHQGSLGPDGGS